MADPLVWIDCEMTGLDLTRDALVEIACIVTDSELNPLDEGIDVVIKPPAEALDSMPEVVREMHTSSGLLAALPAGITLAEAQDLVLGYIRKYVPDSRRVPLCGNSIATDRSFLARDMPELDTFLHYRMIDVSSVKELARRWYPRAYFASPEKHGGHRALADISESIRELQYYREVIFVPLPGPDSATAREVAARIAGGSASPATAGASSATAGASSATAGASSATAGARTASADASPAGGQSNSAD
jgi:oligoribonuclease